MSIPLEQLYHFIDQTAREIYKNPIIIYRFWPYGSKNIDELNSMYTYNWKEMKCSVGVWCHDQEPLNYEYHAKHLRQTPNKLNDILNSHGIFIVPKNLNYINSVFEKSILLHSEKRSVDVEKYQSLKEFLPVYYWSHYIIARDWFRYAQYTNFTKQSSKLFLIYNRAWGGTREYRLKFADLLIDAGLLQKCKTSFNPVCNDIEYTEHKFKNFCWKPQNKLEVFFPKNSTKSTASADFQPCDYKTTEIEIVLETLFDDDRLHLTEKTLRPIACRQPFILMATHGSLRYLQDYGFKTYDSVWDETYDNISDPYQRMQAIIKLMLDIANWSDYQKHYNVKRMLKIADHNHKHFFSKSFFNLVKNELRTNLGTAFDHVKHDPGFDKWLDRWRNILQVQEIQNFLDVNQDIILPTKQAYNEVLEYIKKYPKYIANQKKKV